MIFSAIAQVTMLLTNISLLINDKLEVDFYKLYYISLPVLLYSVAYFIYYLIYWKNTILEGAEFTSRIPATVALITNIIYCVIETIVERPDNPWMFYICTTFIQLINLIFQFNVVKKFIPKNQKRVDYIILQIFSYIFLFLGLWSMYSIVFLNVYISAATMIAACLFSLMAIFTLYIIEKNDVPVIDDDNEDDEFYNYDVFE